MLNYIENIFLFIGYIQKRAALNSSVIMTNEFGEIIAVDHRSALITLDWIKFSKFHSIMLSRYRSRPTVL